MHSERGQFPLIFYFTLKGTKRPIILQLSIKGTTAAHTARATHVRRECAGKQTAAHPHCLGISCLLVSATRCRGNGWPVSFQKKKKKKRLLMTSALLTELWSTCLCHLDSLQVPAAPRSRTQAGDEANNNRLQTEKYEMRKNTFNLRLLPVSLFKNKTQTNCTFTKWWWLVFLLLITSFLWEISKPNKENWFGNNNFNMKKFLYEKIHTILTNGMDFFSFLSWIHQTSSLIIIVLIPKQF